MSREFSSDLEADIVRDAQRAAKQMMSKLAERTTEVDKRPDRPDDLVALEAELSGTIRRNINSVMDVENEYQDGMSRNELGIRMGFKSKIIYNQLSEENARSNIGNSTLCRYSLALGIPVYLLVMPHRLFKKAFLDQYKADRAAGEPGVGGKNRSARKG